MKLVSASGTVIDCTWDDVLEQIQKDNIRFLNASLKDLNKIRVQYVHNLSSWSKMSASVVTNVFENPLVKRLRTVASEIRTQKKELHQSTVPDGVCMWPTYQNPGSGVAMNKDLLLKAERKETLATFIENCRAFLTFSDLL